MNENIDLTKILEGCPKETEFYSTVYGEVKFVNIDCSFMRPIIVRDNFTGNLRYITSGGRAVCGCGECTLFLSKDQRDWSKFVRFWDKKSLDKSVAEKFDPNTLKPFDKVLVRLDENDCWIAVYFSHIDDSTYRAVCDGFYYVRCIPYNDETKNLVGTTDDCPEYYKWWKEK